MSGAASVKCCLPFWRLHGVWGPCAHVAPGRDVVDSQVLLLVCAETHLLIIYPFPSLMNVSVQCLDGDKPCENGGTCVVYSNGIAACM
ncbi:UNVERIFIED_CONTAM: hypothetical protein K2H54_003214 [Gekko kuhli]